MGLNFIKSIRNRDGIASFLRHIFSGKVLKLIFYFYSNKNLHGFIY